MDNILRFPLEQLPFVIVVVVIAFSLHEFAHAYMADRFGDPTPRSMGRVTLNPRAHVDIMGMVLIMLVGFGWAKPVLIRPGNFRNPRLMSIIVSVAGPLSNLMLAFVGMLVVFLLPEFNAYEAMSPGVLQAVVLFLSLHIRLNLVLFLFNLLPLPPLDGYRIIHEFLPADWKLWLRPYEQYAFIIFLLLVFIPPLFNATIGLVLNLQWDLLLMMNDFYAGLFGEKGQLQQMLLPLME